MIVLWLSLGLFVAPTLKAQIVPETVFFDVPSNLVVNPILAPTAQLAAVAG